MTWNENMLSFKTVKSIKAYMAARLSGSEKTEPPFIESRGDCPEDVLIQYYRHGGLTKKHRSWFWTVWRDVLERAFIGRDIETFQNGISLACQLQPPSELKDDPTNFLPKQADKYNWNLASDYPFQHAILKLFLKWEIIPEGNDFWRLAFRGYLNAPGFNAESRPFLISAYNGMGFLNPDDYQLLLTHVAQQNNQNSTREFCAICEDQIYRFDNAEIAAEPPQDALSEGWDNYLMVAPSGHKEKQIYENICAITRDLVKKASRKNPHASTSRRIYCTNMNPRRDATRMAA